MATLEELVVQITAETSQLRAELASATKAVDSNTKKMDAAVESFSNNSAKNVSFFQSAMATMAGVVGGNLVTGALGVAKDAVGALVDNLIEGGKEAMNDEVAFARLASSLKLTGNFSASAAKDLEDYSNEMEGLAGVGSDVIASNLAVLSSLTQLNSKGLMAAETAAINLSAALGKDLGTSTEMIAKAINGNDMAFKKMGITLDLTSDKTKNLEVVTAALSEKFGGAASAKLQTFSGAMFVLNDAYGDMFKEVAKAVTSNQTLIAVINKISQIFGSITDYIQNNSKAFGDLVANGILKFIDTAITIIEVAKVIGTVFKALEGAVRGFVLGLTLTYEAVDALVNLISGADNSDAFSNTMSQVDALNQKASGSTFDTMLTSLKEIRESGATAFAAGTDAVTAYTGKVTEATQAQKDLAEQQKLQGELVASFAQGLADQGAALDSQYSFQKEMLQQKLDGDLISQQEYYAQLQEMDAAKYANDQTNLESALANKDITNAQFQNAQMALAQNFAVEQGKLNAKIKADEEAQNKARLQGYGQLFGGMAALADSSNKELAAIGKAGAISKATIDAYVAINNALANIPAPANYAAAAGIGIQAMANVAKISGTGLKGGINSVPMSASGGNNGDNFPAVLQAGERVVPKETNQDLTEYLNNGGGSGGKTINLNITILPGTGMNNEQVGNLVEQLNNYMNSGGIKLVGG